MNAAYRSAVEGLVWPATLPPRGAMHLALLFQLEQSQWLAPDQIQANQRQQLTELLRHAHATSPFHRPRLEAAGWRPDRPLTEELWRNIPIMTRADWQNADQSLYCQATPPGHGKIQVLRTSGSTAQPVVIRTTELALELGRAYTLRDQFWHRRDWRGKLASIRFTKKPEFHYPDGMTFPSWGMGGGIETGTAHVLSITTPIHQQADWLVRVNPHYFLTYPSNLLALCRCFQDQRLSLPNLREVRVFGELLEAPVREACRQTWNAPVTDLYSANEVNTIALQCPEGEHYHVQEENVRVEVVDANGLPCSPGQVGRVIVTALPNFATPIIRYAIGDYAETMEPCPCGRGLMPLRRLLGRGRNMFTLPSGQQCWPSAAGMGDALGGIRQYQVIQRTVHDIDIYLVIARPLTEDDRAAMTDVFEKNLGHRFNLTLIRVDRIETGPSGKFEDFRSEVTPPTAR